MEAKLYLLNIYNDILGTGVVPQSCDAWQGSFVIGFIHTNKLACLWQEEKWFIHDWTFGQNSMKYCLLLNMVFYARLSEAVDDWNPTSFEMKKWTVPAFLDISRAYNIVLIDVFCGVMLEKDLLLGIHKGPAVCWVYDPHRVWGLTFPYNLLGSGILHI
jgi:hypothetical protein